MERDSQIVDQQATQDRLLPAEWQWGVGCGWLSLGMVVLLTRLLGSLPTEVDSVRLCGLLLAISGLGLVSFSIVLKKISAEGRPQDLTTGVPALLVLAGVISLLLGVLPATASAGSLLVVLLVPAVSLVGWWGFSQTGLLSTLKIDGIQSATLASEEVSKQKQEDSQDIVQWMKRRQQDGVEHVEGMVRLAFEQGQRQRSAHVVMTPPLTRQFEIECEPVGDEECEAYVAEAFPHGFRIEVRRSTDSLHASEIEIGFQVVEQSVEESAA